MYQEEWYSLLPPALLQGVIKYHNEWVWSREQALNIINWLETNSYTVMGIEPWLPTSPGPTPLINDWYQGRKLNSLPVTATEFVKIFTETSAHSAAQENNIVFNISAKKK